MRMVPIRLVLRARCMTPNGLESAFLRTSATTHRRYSLQSPGESANRAVVPTVDRDLRAASSPVLSWTPPYLSGYRKGYEYGCYCTIERPGVCIRRYGLARPRGLHGASSGNMSEPIVYIMSRVSWCICPCLLDIPCYLQVLGHIHHSFPSFTYSYLIHGVETTRKLLHAVLETLY
jgi:hypothetical protein